MFLWGIMLIGGDNCTINDNEVFNVTKHGIMLWQGSWNRVFNNNVHDNTGDYEYESRGIATAIETTEYNITSPPKNAFITASIPSIFPLL